MEYGAVITQDGVNFSIFSRNATRVILHLFDSPDNASPVASVEFDAKTNKTGDVWHVLLTGVGAGLMYLYQIDGPYHPPRGYRFNFNRYLFDPYAKSFTAGSVFNAYRNRIDGSGKVYDLSEFPKCVVIDDSFDWQGDAPLNIELTKTVIYETHLKGFTASKTSGVAHPGTYRGVIEKIDYLKTLGITSIEFLPVFEFDEHENDRVSPRTGEQLVNYWGYSTIGFFSPKTGYSSDKSVGGPVREFKEMVRELHKAGIEVILDVVYNHTAEGNEYGPTFCFKGIENSIYYTLPQNNLQYYMNFSGCGNTLNANHPVVMQFILDSLRYWVTEMHVDGFRFDLASALTRDKFGGVMGWPPITEAISEDPILRNTKIIAEPWDAAGAYHVGNFPGGRWCEWNGLFRDSIRRFIRGDENTSTGAATRLAGSSDLYKDNGRTPHSSINFVTCHDGFTLYDLVSYNFKHNEENGEENRDGSDDNLSYNNGFEGESTNSKIVTVRLKQVKNFFLCLFLAQGVPMMLSGDEVLHTQNGNNNVYCQDNEMSYFNWDDVEKNKDILHFVQQLIKFRATHPMFRLPDFFSHNEIAWYDVDAKTPDWNKANRFLAAQLKSVSGVDFYVAFNMDIYDITLTLPSAPTGMSWYRVADTSIMGSDDFCEPGNEEALTNPSRYILVAHSAILFISKKHSSN